MRRCHPFGEIFYWREVALFIDDRQGSVQLRTPALRSKTYNDISGLTPQATDGGTAVTSCYGPSGTHASVVAGNPDKSGTVPHRTQTTGLTEYRRSTCSKLAHGTSVFPFLLSYQHIHLDYRYTKGTWSASSMS
jgi:hypothetical protein